MPNFLDEQVRLLTSGRNLSIVTANAINRGGTFDGRPIWPTPTIGGLGVIEDLGRVVGLAYPGAGLILVLIGESFGWLGGSLYLRDVCGREEGLPPPVDLMLERRNGELVRALIGRAWVAACHDLADGGLYVALAEMVLASKVGADLEVPAEVDPTGWLFGEEQGRYLLALAPERLDAPSPTVRDEISQDAVGGYGK